MFLCRRCHVLRTAAYTVSACCTAYQNEEPPPQLEQLEPPEQLEQLEPPEQLEQLEQLEQPEEELSRSGEYFRTTVGFGWASSGPTVNDFTVTIAAAKAAAPW